MSVSVARVQSPRKRGSGWCLFVSLPLACSCICASRSCKATECVDLSLLHLCAALRYSYTQLFVCVYVHRKGLFTLRHNYATTFYILLHNSRAHIHLFLMSYLIKKNILFNQTWCVNVFHVAALILTWNKAYCFVSYIYYLF